MPKSLNCFAHTCMAPEASQISSERRNRAQFVEETSSCMHRVRVLKQYARIKPSIRDTSCQEEKTKKSIQIWQHTFASKIRKYTSHTSMPLWFDELGHLEAHQHTRKFRLTSTISPQGSRLTSLDASSTVRLTSAPSDKATLYFNGLSKRTISTTGPRYSAASSRNSDDHDFRQKKFHSVANGKLC